MYGPYLWLPSPKKFWSYCGSKKASLKEWGDGGHYCLQQGENSGHEIARNLIYLLIAAILSFLTNLLPAVNSFIRRALSAQGVLSVIVFNSFVVILLMSTAVSTRIVTILLLKPVQVAMKTILKKVFACKKKNKVAAAPKEVKEKENNN